MSSVLDRPDFVTFEMKGRHLAASPPWLLSALVIAIFMPDEFGFTLFGLRLTVARVILLALAPCVLVAYGRLIGSGRYRFVPSDLIMPLAGLWMIIAPSTVDGLPEALVKGGVMALDFVVAYAAMRAIPQERQEIGTLVKILCVGAAIAGYLSILDTLTGTPFVLHDLAISITGNRIENPIPYVLEDLLRFGLIRATGPFAHPILLGSTMVYGLVLMYALSGTYRVFCGLGCAIGLVGSFSSAPLFALVGAGALVIYGRVAVFPGRWFLIATVAIVAFLLLVLLHPAPFGWLFGHFLLNAQTGNYRLLIWQFGGDVVLASPITGMGLVAPYASRPQWMSATVDSIWLLSAMQFGIPGSVLIALSMVSACWAPAGRADQNGNSAHVDERRLAGSLSVIIFLTIFLGFTVHFWGTSWILMGLIAGMRANFAQHSAGLTGLDSSDHG
jgi:O-antigen ligase